MDIQNMGVTNPDDDKAKDEVIFDLIKSRYENELQRTKDLDDKAGKLIGYVTIVAGLLVGLGTVNILGKLSEPEYYIPYFGGIGLLLFSIISSMMAIRLTKWSTVPEFGPLRSALNDPKYTYRTILRRVFISYGKALTINIKQNDSKVKWIKSSWVCLIGGLVLILTYVIVFTASGNLR